jgi:hypothetical protein
MCSDVVVESQCDDLDGTPVENKCLWFNGKCFQKTTCTGRMPVDSPSVWNSACGANCVKQEETSGICNTRCKNVYHYENTSTGECKIISKCENRSILDTLKRPCGEGCVKRVIEEGIWSEVCSDECWNTEHFEADEDSGVCTLKNDCISRKVNEKSFYVCGSSDCYKNEESEECDVSCNNYNHYYINGRGICKEREICSERKVLNEKSRVCGSGNCYGSEINNKDNDTCVESCINTKLN